MLAWQHFFIHIRPIIMHGGGPVTFVHAMWNNTLWIENGGGIFCLNIVTRHIHSGKDADSMSKNITFFSC